MNFMQPHQSGLSTVGEMSTCMLLSSLLFMHIKIIFQLMVGGVSLEIGQSAQLNVEEDPRQEPDPAVILPLNMVEPIVRVKVMRLRIATVKNVRLMADGVSLEIGQSAQLNVEEDPRQEPEPAVILPLNMVEPIVRDKVMRLRIATVKNV